MFDSILAQAPMMAILAVEEGKEGGTPGWFTAALWIAILGVMLLVMILPGKQQAKRRKLMLADMGKNDRVMTRGGIIGVVVEVREHEVILKVDESNNVRVHFSKQAIQHVFADKDNIDPSQAEG